MSSQTFLLFADCNFVSLPTMHKSNIVLDKKTTPMRFAGRNTLAPVPRYFLYGDTEPTDDWFVNVEPLDQRCKKEGWKIAPHAHPRFVQVLVVHKGGGTMSAEGETHQFSAPALLVVPMHTIHGFKYEENSTGWVLTISERHIKVLNDRFPELSSLWAGPAAVSCVDDGWVQAADAVLRSLDRELDEGELGGVVAAEALLTTLLVLVLRQFAYVGELKPAELSGGAIELVTRFRALIEEHYRDNWALSKYADGLNVSLVQLRAACLSTCEQLPLKLLHERMLIEAKRNLIYSARSISQIAYEVGFNDPAYFTRFFTRHVGEAPAQFRANKAFGNPTV